MLHYSCWKLSCTSNQTSHQTTNPFCFIFKTNTFWNQRDRCRVLCNDINGEMKGSGPWVFVYPLINDVSKKRLGGACNPTRGRLLCCFICFVRVFNIHKHRLKDRDRYKHFEVTSQAVPAETTSDCSNRPPPFRGMERLFWLLRSVPAELMWYTGVFLTKYLERLRLTLWAFLGGKEQSTAILKTSSNSVI